MKRHVLLPYRGSLHGGLTPREGADDVTSARNEFLYAIPERELRVLKNREDCTQLPLSTLVNTMVYPLLGGRGYAVGIIFGEDLHIPLIQAFTHFDMVIMMEGVFRHTDKGHAKLRRYISAHENDIYDSSPFKDPSYTREFHEFLDWLRVAGTPAFALAKACWRYVGDIVGRI